jgi:hypothetical protein
MQDPRDQAMQSTKEFAAKEAKAKADNLAREKEIRGIYDSIISRYEPGGAFEQSQLQQLGVQRAQGVGQATQNLVSSGLYNTTKAAGVGNAWERDVGTPARMRLEDIMTTRRNEAQGEKAGFIERITNAYPSTDPLMAAANAQGFADQYGAGGSGGGGGWSSGTHPWEAGYMGGGWTIEGSGSAGGSGGGSGQSLGAIGGGYDAFGYTPPAGVDTSVPSSKYEDSAYAQSFSPEAAAAAAKSASASKSSSGYDLSYLDSIMATSAKAMAPLKAQEAAKATAYNPTVGPTVQNAAALAARTQAQKVAEALKMVEMEKNRYITPQKATPSVGPTVQNAAALAAQKAAAKKTPATNTPQYGSTAKYSQYSAY